ncbi:MAG: hypothetical protein ACKVS9_02015 [Phycisphaerae bacterium]
MKGATLCAKRLSTLFKSLKAKLGKVTRPASTDPITQIVLGIFSRDMPEAKAREVLDRLRENVVDYNELRVIPPGEMSDTVGDYPEVRTKCEDLTRALNKIFAWEHTVSMDRLGDAAKTEVFNYLSNIPGLEAYTRARVRLLGFNHHAIPLDEAMFAYAKQEEIVDPKSTIDEAQSFLERNIEEEDALDFVALLKKQAWSDLATAVRKGQVEHIRSVPPDRTSRNMLRLIQSGGHLPEAEPEIDELVEGEELVVPREEPIEEAGADGDAGGKKSGKPKSKSGKPEKSDAKSAKSAKGEKPSKPVEKKSAKATAKAK